MYLEHKKKANMKNNFVLTLIAIFLSGHSFADTIKAEPDIKPFTENVMGKVAKNDLIGAFSAMKPYVIIPEAEFQSAVLNSKAQRDQFGARYGKTIGYEYIGQKKLGESLIRYTYIEKTEKHALPWIFYFYKGPAGWVLNSFIWNDQMQQIFSAER